jgi:hypothetical protein
MDSHKGSVVAEVVSFANARGGDLLLGVDEDDDGRADEVCGMPVPDIDGTRNRWGSIIRSGVQHPIPSNLVDIGVVELSNGRTVYQIRIQESTRKPHCVKETGKWYGRDAGGREELTYDEIKQLFLETAELDSEEEKMQNLKQERLQLIRDQSRDLPSPLPSGPYAVLHLFPSGMFETEYGVAQNDLPKPPQFGRNQPVSTAFMTGDGLVSKAQQGGGTTPEYVYFSEAGYFEAVSTLYFLNTTVEGFLEPKAGTVVEQVGGALWTMVPRAMRMFEALGVELPVYAHITLLDAEGYYMKRDEEHPKRNSPAGFPDPVELPVATVESFGDDGEALFDTVQRLYHMDSYSQ